MSSTSEAGGGGALRSSVTEGAAGAKRQRISITLADESRGADLGEAFDAVDHLRERADAGEELLRGEGARRPEEGAGVLPEAHLRDLAGAGADGEVEGGLVVDDQRLDVEPRARIMREQVEALGAEHLADHQRDALPRRLDALLHRVVREERAQDDPEQLHDRHCTPAFSPADLRAVYPTNLPVMRLRSRGKTFGSPADLRRWFDTKRASRAVIPGEHSETRDPSRERRGRGMAPGQRYALPG
jgi:hypothetical protein